MAGVIVDEPLFEIEMPPVVSGTTIQERFESFHELNPWVLDEFTRLTGAWLAMGHQRVGIGMLTEVLRWNYGVTRGDDFKLNNNYRSRYVRLLIERNPQYASAFELREVRAP